MGRKQRAPGLGIIGSARGLRLDNTPPVSCATLTPSSGAAIATPPTTGREGFLEYKFEILIQNPSDLI
ncbi:hypothetical protein NDU88_000770 [Pleurodeles waltl]|uniref:Uncharacterized protein n=1 Tax=Pleurodeles waltl TaxID=8319 RepID=A0AAV7KQY0_PLEWA|nr:hypothetical protein NDU88_000770 [Pleurodeles waltl]